MDSRFCPAFILFVSAAGAVAQNVPPVVLAPVPSLSAYAGAAPASIDFTRVFKDLDASAAVQMSVALPTSTPAFNIALDGQHAPVTVANFLNYVNSGRYFAVDPTTHQLASSFIHRSISNYIVQGGGFIGTGYPANPSVAQPTAVVPFPPIKNEPGISNRRGTIAMAKLPGDPNSATSQWFINLTNNSALDSSDGGFTVFGHVAGTGMNVVNAVAALPVYNFGAPFDSLPLRNYSVSAPLKVDNLVSVPAIKGISPLTFSAASDNPVVSVAVSGQHLLVTPLGPGLAHISAAATDLDGAVARTTFAVTVTTGPARLANLSTRAEVSGGDNVLIGGFIITGNVPKKVLLRATGPSLTRFGIQNALHNPSLELHDKSGSLLAANDDWITATNRQDIIDSGRAPGATQESAILTSLQPGSYTAVLRGAANSAGLALVEVYDEDIGPGSSLLNLSTRGHVGAGDSVMIAGLIISSAPKTILVRALGPTLAQFAVADPLPDPVLQLYNANGVLLDGNDSWQSSAHKAEIEASGFAPPSPLEPALINALSPGNYTAVVRGAGAVPSGVALVEAYPQ